MNIKDYVLTVVRCFRAAASGERRLVDVSIFMFVMSLLFGIIMGIVTVLMFKTAPPSERSTTPTWAAQAADNVLRSIFTKSKDQHQDQDRPTPLLGAQVWIQASDPQARQLGQDMVEFAGGEVASTLANANVQIQWNDQKRDWVVSSLRPDAQELAVFAWFALRRTSNEFRNHQGVDLPDPHAAVIFLVGEPKETPEGAASPRKILATLILLCVLAPSMGALFTSTGMLSFDLDRERAAGALEAFVNVKHPLSSMFLGRALARALTPTVLFLLSICVAGVFLGFPELGTVLLLVAGMFMTAVFLGMIGQVQVVWYHHMYSRFVGQLLFNPAVFFLLVLFFAGGRIFEGVSYLSERASKMNGELPIIEWSAKDLLPIVSLGSVVAVALIALLCLVIDWRLGTRRQGLARVI